MILNAIDLTPANRAALETLLGRRVEDGEAVSLRAFEPAIVSPEDRLKMADQLRVYFAEIDATRVAAPEGERDEAIHEAMGSVRSCYRPRP